MTITDLLETEMKSRYFSEYKKVQRHHNWPLAVIRKMKILKRFLKIVFTLIGVLVLTGIITFWVDSLGISYLGINKNDLTSNNSYIITNVKIIPMNQDTVLADKMVYIKEGFIQKIADTIEVNGIEIIDAKSKYLTPGLIDMHVHVWDRYELGLYLSNGVTAEIYGLCARLKYNFQRTNY
jgi:hypothetical protein